MPGGEEQGLMGAREEWPDLQDGGLGWGGGGAKNRSGRKTLLPAGGRGADSFWLMLYLFIHLAVSDLSCDMRYL